MKASIKLYLHYVSLHVKSIMQYKKSFFLTALGQFLVSFNAFAGIFFMFQRFADVEGFTYYEVLLCFSIMLMSFSLAECVFRGFDRFSSLVISGEFDRVMVRPKSEVIQVLGSRFELTRMGRLLQALITFVYGITHGPVDWTADKVAALVFMLIGGAAIFSGLFMIYAALCFFTLEGLEFMNVFTDGAREHGKYPISIYGERMLRFCTYIIPYALVQYYPLMYVLGRSTGRHLIILPLCGILFIVPCYALWRFGVRHYKSSGS